MAHVYASHIYNNSSCTRTSLQHHSLRHEYVLRNLCISAVYANIGPGQYRNIYFTLVYAVPTLTISNLIIVTDLILAVVRLLERDMNRLVVEAGDALEPVKLWDEG